jgi:hypothetical protein
MWRKRLSVGLVLLGLVLSTARCGGGGGTVTIAAPGGVAIQIGNGQVTITWNAVNGATTYHIYWRTGTGVTKQNSTKVSNVTSPFTHAGLTNGTQYCYRVVAGNTQTESNLSEEKCGTPAAALRTLSVAKAGAGGGTVTTTPPGINCGVTCTAQFTEGAVVNLLATPDAGSQFDGWSGNADCTDGQVTLNADVACTATFSLAPTGLQVSGTVEYDTGGPVVGATCEYKLENNGALDAQFTACGTTNASGAYSFGANPSAYPARVLVQMTRTTNPPSVATRWSASQAGPGAVGLGRVILPDLSAAGMNLAGTTATRPDGTLRIDGVPGNVASIAGQSYDPGANPDAFPGEFMDNTGAGLNSTVFLTVSALDGQGQPVVNLPQPATIRVQIPQTQWADLEDTQSGNGQIDIPIYSYNYQTGQWEYQGDGHLENNARQIIPEESEPDIVAGTYPGPIFAVLTADHFSWWNVDYPYIGPWTLSRLDREKRNNECLYKAMKLAEKIAKSQKGRDAYAKVNKAGADLNVELSDGNGPELKNNDLEWTNDSQTNGEYEGDSGGREDEFKLNNKLWELCNDPNKKKEAILILASTILHESAHWKDDVKKNPDDDTDTPGEEGKQLEKDIFGGDIHYDPSDGRLELDRNPVDQATMDNWLNHDNWPPAGSMPAPQAVPAQEPTPLQITVSMSQSSFGVFDPVPVDVEYKNIGPQPIQVLNVLILEDYPIRFDIINQTTQKRVPFRGKEIDTDFGDPSFITLQPQETLVKNVDLRYDQNNNLKRYDLREAAQYDFKAVYSPFFGLPETESNMLTFFVSTQTPGSISGRVRDATNQNPIANATLRAKIGTTILGTATTDGQGNYQIADLQPATYTVEAFATGYIRSERSGVVVASGQNTGQTNFLLSPLLAEGELRIVLGWGADPRDLDSHLWLPMETRYHLYYGRRGDQNMCPWANLDQDVTGGSGPETMTIKQRVATGAYQYAVHHFSGSSDIPNSGAQVSIYDARGLLTTITPNPGIGRWWHVFSMDGATGSITEVNQMLDSYEPYPDTDIGCNPPDLNVGVSGNGEVTSDVGGINCRQGSGTCAAEYPADTQVTLTATPDAGEQFLGWTGDCSGIAPTCILTMDTNKSVGAGFSRPVSLTVAPTGGGTVTSDVGGINCGTGGTACTANPTWGDTVILTATPDAGEIFNGWVGDCVMAGTNPTCNLTMGPDKWVGASFSGSG